MQGGISKENGVTAIIRNEGALCELIQDSVQQELMVFKW